LIDTLDFKIGTSMMGQTHTTAQNGNITITIRLRVPAKNNNIYGGSDVPVLNHFDIIRGEVTKKVDPPATIPENGQDGYSTAYKTDSIATTRVVARFGKTAAAACPVKTAPEHPSSPQACSGIATTAWTENGGFINVTFTDVVPDGKKYYYRLRGTNQPLGTANKTDACGNPFCDTLDGGYGTNSGAKAFADLYFYTNPVYAANNWTGISAPPDEDGVSVYPNPTSDIFYIDGANISKVSVYNSIGELVKSAYIFDNIFDMFDLPIGAFSLELETTEIVIINKSIIKK
jgi:hypothetical protein